MEGLSHVGSVDPVYDRHSVKTRQQVTASQMLLFSFIEPGSVVFSSIMSSVCFDLSSNLNLPISLITLVDLIAGSVEIIDIDLLS